MASEGQDLTALIGSRICHDLVSPLSAIGNGVELMEMAGQGGSELGLISESVASAKARLQFFRIAFGAADRTQSLGRTELVAAAEGALGGRRLKVVWRPTEEVARDEARLAFLALLCCESAMPYGGTIIASRSGAAWEVAGAGSKLKVEPELWGGLETDGGVSVTPAEVHFAFAPEAAAAAGRRIRATTSATEVRLAF